MSKKNQFCLVFLLIIGFGLLFLPASQAASALASKLQGYILLQVESHGEAWYVIPKEQTRVYMANGAVAYQIMRTVSLGIKDSDLAKIPVGIESRFNDLDTDNDGLADRLEEGLGTNPNLADTDNDGFSDGNEIKSNYNPLNKNKLVYDITLVNRLKGYILLQVEKQGQAWYLNPKDGKRYYMKDGDAAYQIMRYLSLGITNTNLNLITNSTRSFNVNTTPPSTTPPNSTSTPPSSTSTPPGNNPPGGGGGGGGGSNTTPDYDIDNDGYNAAVNGGNDCNDNNASIHPGATEICGNSIDEDCSGADTQCASSCTDTDADGYGSPASNSCQYSTLDCNNSNASVHPNATEICGNGIDEDCSGADLACVGSTIILDNGQSGTTSDGTWQAGFYSGAYNNNYLYSPNTANNWYQWTTTLAPGTYQVSAYWQSIAGRATAAQYQITHSSGTSNVTVDQTANGSQWNVLGTYTFGANATVRLISGISTQGTCADAVRFVPVVADTTAPTVPTNLSASVSGSQVSLSWTASTDAVGVTGYMIWKSTTNGGLYSTYVGSTNSTSYVHNSVPNGTHYYVVKAYDAVPNYSENSTQATAVVSVVSDNTAPTIPTGLTALASGSQISLSWTSSTDTNGVSGYNILRSQTNNTGYLPIATSTTNSYVNTGLVNGTYYYVARAYDAALNYSNNSSQASGVISGITSTCEATGNANCYYISPSGSDSNNGSISAPFASTNPIINTIVPGDYIYFRGGTYGPAAKGQIVNYAPWLSQYYAIAYIQRSGTAGNPITFKAYPGESPVFDTYLINPEFDQTQFSTDPDNHAVQSPDYVFAVRHADYIVISGFEMIHGGIEVFGSDYTWINDNHIHDLLSDRSNNGLIVLYFTEHAYVNNNNLHDTYQRSIYDSQNGWMLNTIKSHYDAAHNGCITTLSGDTYEGYGVESSGPFEFVANEIHDCPVHLFIKNPQGQLVNADGVNLLIKDNYFYGDGFLADIFQASNVVFENNLFKGIDGISYFGNEEATGNDAIMNEIISRNVTFRNNVFTGLSTVVQMHGQGFLLANGIYSTAMADKLKFYNNVVVFSSASAAGSLGWNQGGYVFGNSYVGMIDASATPPSKTLSRIDSVNNCYVNSQGTNLAFLKHWVNGAESITGYNFSNAQSVYGVSGSGNLFPTNTSLTVNFTNPNSNDFSVKSGSACSSIPNIGLLNPGLFTN